MAEILDGKKVAQLVKDRIKAATTTLTTKPKLAVLYDPDNDGSRLYVGMKKRAAEKVGITVAHYEISARETTANVLARVALLNQEAAVTGILIQAPLPAGIDEQTIFSAVAPEKDVDGLGATSQGRLFTNQAGDYPVAATPKGVMTLLAHYELPVAGKNALVIGRSQLFGRPMAALLLNAHATVTVAHHYTPAAELNALLAKADLVVVGVGKPNFVHGDQLKSGAVVIDVGMNLVAGKAVGDVDFDSASQRAAYLTPVPGGVGPMTIATLFENTLHAAQAQAKSSS
ncbi:bifunctional 5,10-methylenetetrahydrofolate dehydrogenase/5,10-methenyltetrahydrofolate cyclohydrolase [Leuconostocaceae bacterium ESL0958]|nr:bifunctional 5,10-methylenetetrahydrofolate dehydrogenase/5,10-methenyltetrahydrofolate cyclohydrolase [Leuconostocaceae bacterium ESL0958]